MHKASIFHSGLPDVKLFFILYQVPTANSKNYKQVNKYEFISDFSSSYDNNIVVIKIKMTDNFVIILSHTQGEFLNK